MLCTEDRCKAALLEALLFSKINNAVKLHTEAESAGTDECKRAGGCPWLCTQQPTKFLLWLSFAAFRIFCLLEVKSHVFLLTAHCEDIPWQGYPGWCRIALARPWFSWSDFCPGRRQGGHKDAKGNLEGGLDFLGSQLLCAVLIKCIFNGQSNCIVLYMGRKSIANIMYSFCLPLRFPGHLALLQFAFSHNHWKKS